MFKVHNNRLGLSALAAYVGAVVVTAVFLYTLGATSNLFQAPVEKTTAEKARYGKMWVKSDEQGHCREFALDNKTQELVDSGVVVCDRERSVRFRQRSKADSFREAFGGSGGN